jgi:acyl carrier protein
MPFYLLVLALLAFIVVGLLLHGRSNVRLATKHLADRPVLDPEEFGRRYFSVEEARIATKLLNLLQEETTIPLAQMHPDDRLVQDLRIEELDSLAVNSFLMSVEDAYDLELPAAALEDVRTFRQIVTLVSQRVHARGTA